MKEGCHSAVLFLRFLGICTDIPGHIALVCDFIRDGSVLDQLHSRGFSIKEKYRIIRQAATGVTTNFSNSQRCLFMRYIACTVIT